ncbi:MAG: hypothetical protein AAFR93_12790, partial [Pseudomonadota bacterium]
RNLTVTAGLAALPLAALLFAGPFDAPKVAVQTELFGPHLSDHSHYIAKPREAFGPPNPFAANS